ncbi:MAG: hypothetical protein ACYDBQ_08695 [Thermoplasmatota archaeon]
MATEVADAAVARRLMERGLGSMSDGTLRLEPVEAAWAIASGRLEGETLPEYLRAHPGLEVSYLAYSDLRERGLQVRAGNPLVVMERRLPTPAYEVECHAEREPLAWTALADAARRRRVVAVVDDDGEVTHYRLSLEEPSGSVVEAKLPVAVGHPLGDRVLVEGPPARRYHELECVGTLHDGRLLLSNLEAEALRRRGVLQIAPLPDLGATLDVHAALRRRGVATRSGLRFGTHLRGYRMPPGEAHADWLIQCCRPDESIPWSSLSRGVRLAHGVRKVFLAAACAPEALFVRLDWFRP